MFVHPFVLRLSKRLWVAGGVAGACALLVFSLSLSKGAYPGRSAALAAEAAGVLPPSSVAHPLFSFFTRQVAALDIGSLTVRLNLFSALCGALCAGLLCALVGRLILFYACEDDRSGGAYNLPRSKDNRTERDGVELPQDVASYNRGVARIATFGGLMAAFLLVFMIPTWSAATRLDTGHFSLLLALLALAIFPPSVSGVPFWVTRMSLSVVILIIGAIESMPVMLLLPVFAYLLFKGFLVTKQRGRMLAGLFIAVLSGAAIGLLACWSNEAAFADASWTDRFYQIVSKLAFLKYHESRAAVSGSGWLLVLCQTMLPAAFLLFGRRFFIRTDRTTPLVILLFLLVITAPSLLNLGIVPLSFYLKVGYTQTDFVC